MNTEISTIVNRARHAQHKNHMLTPDKISMDTVCLTAMFYDKQLGGFVARKNTYKFKKDLKKAGFIWLSDNKVWIKLIARKG